LARRDLALNAVDHAVHVVPQRRELVFEVAQLSERRFEPNDQVFVKENDRCWLVRIGEISVLESEGNYTRVIFGGSRPLIYRSLNSLEARLDPRHFFRASRKHIINLAKVERIEPWFSSGLMVHLEGGHKIEMSRRQGQKFRELRSL
jgi:two-component system LytT family response regulator